MNKDIYFGLRNESLVLELLKKDYPDIAKTPTTSHPYDFITTDVNGIITYFELKSRRCSSTQYPDTMIGANKLQFAKLNPDKQFVFLFKFTDGIFRHKYLIDKEYTIRKGGRFDRNRPEVSNYAYIPIGELEFYSESLFSGEINNTLPLASR